jgi:hypothetical protein
MPDKIEIWYTPIRDTGQLKLLESREFNPAIDPPTIYVGPYGKQLIAACVAHRSAPDGRIDRVDCVEM